MKYLFFQFMLTLCLSASGQTSNLVGKTWAYKKIVFIYQQDSLVFFSADSAKNYWYVGRVSMVFNLDHTYSGTDINGQPASGTWASPNAQTLVVGKDTNQVLSVAKRLFKTTATIRFRDPVTDVRGTLYTEFYSVPIPSGDCVSIQSGDWASSTTWSCGHQPTIVDLVTINATHTITVSTGSAQAQRVVYNGGTLIYAMPMAKLFLFKDEQ